MLDQTTLRAGALAIGALALSLSACGPDDAVVDPQASEGTLVGIVSLSDSDSAAGVLVEAGSRSVTTEDDGSFRFENVSAGAVLVSASLEGYEADDAFITVIAGQDNAVELVLEPRSAGPQVVVLGADARELAPGEQTGIRAVVLETGHGPYSVVWEASGGFDIKADANDPFSAIVTAPDLAGAAGEISVVVTDGEGRQAEETLAITTRTNASPLVASITAAPAVVERGGEVSLSVIASDADGDALSYAWSGAEGWALDATDQASVVAIAPDEPGAQATFMVTVSDEQGSEASAQVSVSTLPNQAPRIRSATALPLAVLPRGTIELQADAVDPDGDAIVYEWLVPEGWEVSSGVGSQISLGAPAAYSAAGRITLIASDDFGASDQTVLVVSTVNNQGPTVSSLITTRPVADPGELLFLEALASHPFEDDLTFSWEANGGFTVITENRPENEPALRAPAQENAVGTVRVTVTDSAGATAESAMVVQTRAYAAPVINAITSVSAVEFGDAALVSVSAHDPEGGDLSYVWTTTSSNVAILSPSSRTTEIIGGNPDELVVATVVVTNSVGKITRGETRVRIPGF